MAEEEKKEEAQEEKKEEKKKEGWWAKTKKSFSDSNRESKIQSAWEKAHDMVEIYTGNEGMLSSAKTFYGEIDEENNRIHVWGKVEEVPYSSVLVKWPKDSDKELPKYWYVIEIIDDDSTKCKATITEDEKEVEYEREGSVIVLDPNVREVPVIKVKNTYFLKLDEKN